MDADSFLDKELGSIKEKKAEFDIPQGVSKEEEIGLPGAKAEPVIFPSPGKEAAAADDIDSLIARANTLIAKGDFDGARRVYIQIKGLKRELPKKFKENEEKLSDSLVGLNEKLVEGIDKTLSTDFNEKFGRINKLFDEAYSFIKEGKISDISSLKKVEDIYAKIKQTYQALPGGFIDKSVMIQDQMLKLYKIIITNKKNILYDDFRKKSGKIVGIMKDVAAEISSGNFENASKLFSMATQTYKELPKGFLREKTELQGSILDIYQKLILGKESKTHDEFENLYSGIKGMFEEAYAFVKSDRLKEAGEIYNRIAEAYSKLPKGYYSRKADLEIEMMELNRMIALKKDKELLEETKARINEIEMLIESTKNYIISKEFDLAKEAYEEMVSIYNSIPEGFFEENVKIQNRIVKLYKDLLVSMHSPLVSETTKEKAKYDELVKLLVDIHQHVKKKEFGEIKRKYLLAYKLYHELPLSVIEDKKNLYTEIYRIYEELRLYVSLEKLAEHAEKEEYGELAMMLDKIAGEYNLLSKKYPEDIELFKNIQAKCLIYLQMLKRFNEEAKTSETAADVKRKIENAARMRDELGSQLPVEAKEDESKAAGTEAEDYLKGKVDAQK